MSALTTGLRSGAGLSPGGMAALGLTTAGIAGAAINNNPEKHRGMFVREGFVGVRVDMSGSPKLDRDGNPIVYGKGFRPYPPLFRGNRLVDIRDQVSDLGEVPIDRNGLTVVRGNLFWGISEEDDNPAKSFVVAKEGEMGSLVVKACVGPFRSIMSMVPPDRFEVLSQKEWDDMDEDAQLKQLEAEQALTEKICKRLGQLCSKKLLKWGAEIRGLTLENDYPHPFRSMPTNGNSEALAASQMNGNGNGHYADAVT